MGKTVKPIKEGDYDHEFIMNNPIPAQCVRCKRAFIDGEVVKVWSDRKQAVVEVVCNEAIRAPQIENCRCFYCGGNLRPLNAESYRERQAIIENFYIPSRRDIQPSLF